jgi:hypothetical protein
LRADNLLSSFLRRAAFPVVDADSAGSVADDVQGGTAHVEQTVNAVDQANVGRVDVDGLEHHRQHNHAGAGGTGRADGGKGRGDNDHNHLAEGQIHADALGKEHSRNALIDRGAVHVDRRAQRQDEGGNVVLNTHLVAALLGDRQRSDGGGGGERKDRGGKHALEELQRAHLRKHLDGERVNEHDMNDVADVCRQQNQTEIAEDLRTLVGDDPGHQAENADRGNRQNEAHDLLRDLVEGHDHIRGGLALLARDQNAAAEEEGDHNDLEHGGLQERIDEVRRENALDGVNNIGSLCLIGRILGHFQNAEGALEEVGNNEADHAGDRGRAEEVDNGFPADLADLADVAHGNHAVHDGKQNQRYNNVLQEVDEDIAEGLDIGRCDLICPVYAKHRPHDCTDDNAEHHAEQDLEAKTHFFLFFHNPFTS